MEKLNFEHWGEREYAVFLERLNALADEGYRDFHAKLVPDIGGFLGVRVPELRKIAKEIIVGDWRSFLALPRRGLYEEKMVAGMVSALGKCPVEEKLRWLAAFIPTLDNWAVCDVTVGDCKFIRRCRESVRRFLEPYFWSENPFEVRFAAVVLLGYYVDADCLSDTLETYDRIRHPGYYVRMAVAWGISVCFAKFPVETADYLRHCSLDDDTYHKSLRKILESNRVSPQDKQMIRQMKRTARSE